MSKMALRTLLLGLSISGASLAQTPAVSPKVLAYEEGDSIPPGYQLRERPRLGLVITGAVLGGAAYGFVVLGAVDTKLEDKGGFLLIPLAGPWLTLATGGADDKTCPPNADECEDENNKLKRVVLALDGLAQAAGAIMLTTGFAFPRKRLERTDITVSLLPAALGQHGYGAALVGAF